MVYAILLAVGDYKDVGSADIPTYKHDLDIMRKALNKGLRIPEENIRVIAGNDDCGTVHMKSLAHAVADVQGQLSEEDVFLLYFSGHGQLSFSGHGRRVAGLNTEAGQTAEAVQTAEASQATNAAQNTAPTPSGLVFSDGIVMLQSVIDYVSRLSAGGKIVILDCCYAGNFEGSGPRTLQFDQAFSEFAGKGIAVMASTSADETARLWPQRQCSFFTGALSQAIMELTAPAAAKQAPTPLTAGIRTSGKVSLNEIYEVMMRIITIRNYHNPAGQQYPIFRSSIGGTIFFRTGDDSEHHAQTWTTSDHAKIQPPPNGNIHHLKSLNTKTQKRRAVFVILPLNNKATDPPTSPESNTEGAPVHPANTDLASATRDIVNKLRAGGGDDEVVWCYFGADERDILTGLHYAYTIWAASEALRRKYYAQNAAAEVCDGIYVFRNNSYDVLRRMQTPTKSREQFVHDVKKLLSLIVSNAERFVYDLQEVKNRTRTMAEMRALYGPWIERVKNLYIKLSDEDVAPNDLHDWSEAIYDLAGWVADLAILFEGECARKEERSLIDHTIRRYHEAVEKVRQAEANI